MRQNSNDLIIDIAIIGGGLAGLSLAAELAAPEFAHLKIAIIEPRSEYKRDKTWSYWRQAPHAFSAQETAVWHAWQVKNTQKTVTVESINAENYVYASIASDDFYAAAQAKIKACPHISLLLGVSVENINNDQQQAFITLSNGNTLGVKQTIFDSRPPEKNTSPHLTQHFYGLHLKAQLPIFDANSVQLMDFSNSLHGIHFIYVLPYSATEALVETTWFCQHSQHDDYTEELNQAIAQRWPNTKFDIAYSEKGSLPLVSFKAHAQKPHTYWPAGQQKSLVPIIPTIIPIGTRAGTARAATGYAFIETLQDSARLANLIKKNQMLTSFKRNKIDAWMDRMFLSFLSSQPTMAPQYFVALFANCQPASLVRFLSGSANWRDKLRVMLAMPAKPMLKHLLTTCIKH